jgi:hypothetical protein
MGSCDGLAGSLALLAVVEVNDTPHFAPIKFLRYDQRHEWQFAATVSPGLSGQVLSFQVFGTSRWSGRNVASDVRAIEFR